MARPLQNKGVKWTLYMCTTRLAEELAYILGVSLEAWQKHLHAGKLP